MAGDNPLRSENSITAAFFDHAEVASLELNHDIWSQFLSKTVFYAGYSTARLGKGEKRQWIGSRMGYGNDLPSRYENNRVMLGKLTEAHYATVRYYRAWL